MGLYGVWRGTAAMRAGRPVAAVSPEDGWARAEVRCR
jgi:hypothetical protein